MNIFNHKKTLLIIILIIAAFFAYWYLFLSKQQLDKELGKNVKSQDVNSYTKYDKDFVSSLLGLNSVNLDVSIFESKTYQLLNYPDKPFEIIYPKDTGRKNPFLPIGVDNIIRSNAKIEDKKEDLIGNTSTSTIQSNTVSTTTSTTTKTNNPKPIPKNF